MSLLDKYLKFYAEDQFISKADLFYDIHETLVNLETAELLTAVQFKRLVCRAVIEIDKLDEKYKKVVDSWTANSWLQDFKEHIQEEIKL